MNCFVQCGDAFPTLHAIYIYISPMLAVFVLNDHRSLHS